MNHWGKGAKTLKLEQNVLGELDLQVIVFNERDCQQFMKLKVGYLNLRARERHGVLLQYLDQLTAAEGTFLNF